MIGPDAPFSLDHAGFEARFRATREQRGWSLAFLAFAPLWALLVAFGVYSEGVLDVSNCCFLVTVPFILGVSWLGADAAITRQDLRLANGQLLLVTRKVFVRQERIPLKDLVATVDEHFTSKGGRIVHLVLTLADGSAVRIPTPNWTTPDLEALAGILNGCALHVDPETERVPPAALQALRGKVTAG